MNQGTNDWRDAVRRRAREGGMSLPPDTVDELAAHLEDLYEAARRRGASIDDARRRALQALDESALSPLDRHAARAARDARTRTANDTALASRRSSFAMFHALRIALRQFRQHPAFALSTVLVLGLGTGAAAAVYTIVDTVVLRPLPYHAPDQLVTIWDVNASKGLDHERLSPVTFMDERRLPAFADAAAWWWPDVNLVDPGLDPVRVNAVETSPNVFTVLGVSPVLGAGFPKEPFFSRQLVCVISDRLWRTRYNADPAIVGRQVKLNGADYTVAGVMPPGFAFPDDVDVWQRATWDFTQHSRSAHFMEAVARLAPGATLADATAQLDALSTRLSAEFPATNDGWNARLQPLLEQQLGYYRPALLVLFGAVGLLLVIACLNVASLLLTRALSREREIAVRVAIGAAPRQIVAQIVAESFVLAAAGAAVGLAAAAVAARLVIRFSPVRIPRLADASSINPHVLAFGVAIVMGATLLFGLVPSLVLLGRGLSGRLQQGGRGSTRGARRLYITLVSGEIALAVALLLSSALLVRTVRQMTDVPLGVRADGAVLANIQLASNGFPTWPSVAHAHEALLNRIRQEPGVTAAGLTDRLPTEVGWRIPFSIVGQPVGRAPELPQAQIISISDGYFQSMGALLQSGRFFTPHDDASSEPVVIVNEAFARRYLSGGPALDRKVISHTLVIGPLGQSLMQALPPRGQAMRYPSLRVVGVVADVRDAPLGQPNEPAIYMPDAQYPFRAVTFTISARDRQAAETAFRRALHDLAPNVPPGTPHTWTEYMRAETAEPRLLMSVLLFFGALAGLLAAIGVYGLLSWSVALRRRELAIRLTLGARPARIGGLVVRQTVVIVGSGLAGGWALVLLAQGALSHVLFHVSATDAVATGAAGLVMIVAAALAVLPPVVRAMRLDPTDGLRAE